jgi:hypothetical protein
MRDFMAQGVDRLLRDKTRRSRIPALPAAVRQRTVALTLSLDRARHPLTCGGSECRDGFGIVVLS